MRKENVETMTKKTDKEKGNTNWALNYVVISVLVMLSITVLTSLSYSALAVPRIPKLEQTFITQEQKLQQRFEKLVTKQADVNQRVIFPQKIVQLEQETISSNDEHTRILSQGETLKQQIDSRSTKSQFIPLKQFGNYYALIIGIKDYIHWPKLNTAENDVNNVDKLLKNKYGFQTKVLINATRSQVLQSLYEYRRKLTENDSFLIYYVGYGVLAEKTGYGHWIPFDGERDNKARWISFTQISDYLSVISAKHVLIVADSVYTNTLTRSSIPQLENGMSDYTRNRLIEVLAKRKSRTVLTSGRLNPVLDESGGVQSVFAKTFLDILVDNDDILEGQRLYKELSAKVAFEASNRMKEQVPQYSPIRFTGHELGDFLFVPVSK